MKQTLFFGVTSFLERTVSFLLLPVLTNVVSPSDYAIWTQSIIVSGIIYHMVLLGFEKSIIKFFPLWGNKINLQHSTMLLIFGYVFTFLLVISSFFIYFDDYISQFIFGDSQLVKYIPLLLLLIFSEMIFEFLIGILRVNHQIKLAGIYLLSKGIWRISILLLVLIGMELEFFDAFFTFVWIQLIIVLLLFIKHIPIINILKSYRFIDKKIWSNVLHFSLPLVVLVILLLSNNFVGHFFISNFYNLEILAIYAAHFSLVAIVIFFYSILNFTMFPKLSHYLSLNDKNNKAFCLVRGVFIVYLSLLMPFLIMISLHGSDILELLTNHSYKANNLFLFFLTLSQGFYGLFEIAFYVVLLKKGSVKALLWIILAITINITINIVLIENYRIISVITASLVANMFLAFVFIYMSKKALNWSFPSKAFSFIIMRSVLMGIVIYINNLLFNPSNLLAFVFIFIFAGFIYILLDFYDKKNSFFATINSKNNL